MSHRCFAARAIGRALALTSVLAVAGPARAGDGSKGKQLSTAQVVTVVRARRGDLERCYRRERPRLGALAGRMDVYWEVRDTGKVSVVYARTDTLGAPELRQCVESAIQRWVFPRFEFGYMKVAMPFAFAPNSVTFGAAAAGVSAVPDIEGGSRAMRALLLRFGPRFVSFGCVAGKRSFPGKVCDTPIASDPRIGLDRRYTVDRPVVDVGRALVRFEVPQIDANGFSFRDWPPNDGKDRYAEPGPFDGFATWPPDAFKVTMTAHGEAIVHDGVNLRCQTSPRSPCKDADRAPPDGGGWLNREQTWPLLAGEQAREVERLLAPVLRRFESRRRLRLAQKLSVDLDGDAKPETLLNVAVTDVELRPARGAEFGEDGPSTWFFTVLEKNGRLSRLPVQTRPSMLDFDGMDGAVLGWVDIEGDGQLEILMETPGYENLTWQLVRYRDGAFRPVAEFGYTYYGQVSDNVPPLVE